MESSTVKTLQQRVALNRDQAAYKELFLHFFQVLTPFALTLLKSSQIAEEVVNDVLLNIWQLESRLSTVQDLHVYLFRAVKNRAINHLTRNVQMDGLVDFEKGKEFQDSAPDPLERIQRNELRKHLVKVVLELPPRCGMVYHLVKERGLSYREVANIMSISENTVDRQLNNALHKLIKALQDFLREDINQKKVKEGVGMRNKSRVMHEQERHNGTVSILT